MEHPVKEIPGVIHLLTQSPPSIQQQTLEKYFTKDAKFTHPFCRTGSWSFSRWLILCIYQWYKILSPTIDLTVKSVAFDEQNFILYVTIHQVFRIWFIPFDRSPVDLTTVLQLTKQPGPSSSPNKSLYYIISQNDLYQFDQFILFVSPYRVGYTLVLLFQCLATLACVVGSTLLWPFTWTLENAVKGQKGDRPVHTYGLKAGKET